MGVNPRVPGLVAAVAVGAGGPGAAPGHGSGRLVGNPRAGRPMFVTTCGVCHTLRAAGTIGTSGPDLDAVSLTELQIITAVSKGGAAVMPRAAAARFTTQMVPYGGVLTKAQIDDVAAFVYAATRR
jgi:mono/diheme cytochrome c family protein